MDDGCIHANLAACGGSCCFWRWRASNSKVGEVACGYTAAMEEAAARRRVLVERLDEADGGGGGAARRRTRVVRL